jgi:hypothetical protein
MNTADTAPGLPLRRRQAQNFVARRATEDHTHFDAFSRPDRGPVSVRPLLLRPDFREDPFWSPEYAEGDEEGATP